MKKKAVSGILLTLLLVSMFVLTFSARAIEVKCEG
jgi:hypothetical protein